MKKIFFILLVIAIIFISLYKPLDIDLIIDGIYAFVDMLSILVYFMLAFWLWGQIFIIHSNVVYPLLFLILKSIYFNIQITVFIFSIFLLFFEQAYISKELLIIYISITNFFPVFKNAGNEEYIKSSIKLIGLSIFIFIDIFSIKSPDLTFQYIVKNQDVGMFLLGLYFIKTLIHSSFYAVLFSCFYMALKDFFYKDEEITYSKVFKKFIENILR